MWTTPYKNVKVLLKEGPEILMEIFNLGQDRGYFILSAFKNEDLIIVMKFDYLGKGKCHLILRAFVNKGHENRVEMLVIGFLTV